MIDATSFAEVEIAVGTPMNAALTAFVSNITPSPIPAEAVIIGSGGGGSRAWGEATTNIGVNVYAQTDAACLALVKESQDFLATLSDNLIHHVSVPVGGTSIPRQSPPFQRYYAATVHLRGQETLPLDLS